MSPRRWILCLAALLGFGSARAADSHYLWKAYQDFFRSARYIDLTQTIRPDIPVWAGFGQSRFSPAEAGSDIENFAKKGEVYRYGKHGFEATRYSLTTDQLGTQLDPPAHWSPDFPAIDELPATYTLRPLVVISIVSQVRKDPGYALQVKDIRRFEARYGRIPAGSVVFVRSDWSKDWPDPELSTRSPFPGVSLAALRFLHEERRILFHGHEPLDTDSTPDLEGERWLLTHGYTQAEGVANLDKVPPVGALVAIGFPKFAGGTGGYARYIAIAPRDWKYGVRVGELPEAPLARQEKPLHWDEKRGYRVRD